MNSENEKFPTLRELGNEVLAEGREWMRQRLEQKLQEQANRRGSVFPPKPKSGVASAQKTPASAHRVGIVELSVWQGFDPTARQWDMPIRQIWGLRPARP